MTLIFGIIPNPRRSSDAIVFHKPFVISTRIYRSIKIKRWTVQINLKESAEELRTEIRELSWE